MNLKQKIAFIVFTATLISGLTVMTTHAQFEQKSKVPNRALFMDSTGFVSTLSTTGEIDTDNAFFQNLGSNGRSCATCHQPSDGMSITPVHIQQRFLETFGRDPVFRTNDGSNCDHNINVSTVDGRAQSYSLLLSRGLIRVALPVPVGAEFEVVGVRNPYHCNETDTLSMYRRPLPSTNLRFLSAVMWDGRESTPPSTQKIAFDTNAVDLISDLRHQSVDATNGHAQAVVPLSITQQDEIVDFETSLYTAQAIDREAGDLNANGATGGPDALVSQAFYIGSNDPLGLNPNSIPFTSIVFNLFNSFAKSSGRDQRDDRYRRDDGEERSGEGASQRASIARGQTLFNTRNINITNVGGLNDALGAPVIQGTCGTCHDSFNVGNHSIAVPLNIGVSDPNSPLNVDYLPVITLRNRSNGMVVRTTDPGRAMITGKWEDISKVKGPILRGLSSRAPFFHNGSAATLADVVEFYDRRFDLNLTPREKADLVAFLSAL